MKPVVDGLMKKYGDRYDIRVLNTSKRDPMVMKLSQAFGIRYVPTFVFVNSDGSLGATVVGSVPPSRLERELAKLE